jgi:hypothetical protein
MGSMMRRRSTFVLTASILIAAEALINSLYSATPLQTLYKSVEGEALLVFPFGERRQIIGIFGKGSL